jgi:site-specific DNA-methyltransferase (adenine-specific)
MKMYRPTENVTIYEADCLDFLKSLPDESVDIIITDPGYSGMNNKLNFGRGRIVGNYQKKDNDKWFTEFKDEPNNFKKLLTECFRVMKNNRHIYIMFDNFSILSLGSIMREVFNVKNIIVWDKMNIGMGHYFRRRHEFIIFATKGYKKLNTRDIPDVWKIKRVLRGIYPTQKPVELFDYMLKGSFEEGFMVCDPFVGSGSSIISALKYKGNFIGADISNKACEIANKRVINYIQEGEDNYKKIVKGIQLHF